ncbi:MAG: ATP-binding protein [Rhizobiaceae bacterium]
MTTDDNNSGSDNQPSRRLWYFIATCFFFGCMIYLRPDLVWQLLTFLAVCMVGLAILTRDDGLKKPAQRPGNRTSSIATPRYHQLIDGLLFPVYLLDQNANVEYSNLTATSAFGPVNAGDRITIRFRQPQLNQMIEKALLENKAVTTDYHEPVPADRWFQVQISPVPFTEETADERSEKLFLLAFHDQTEARRIDQMRSDFIANASHELRTPLASLLGFIETIKGPAKDDIKARDRFMDVMLDQAERMSRLVNDLLSLSRIEMKAHVKPSETVSLRDILLQVVSSLQALAAQMKVSIDLDAREDLSIIGDHDELVQVFENLVENACKYGQEGERVLVTLEKVQEADNSFASVSIRDFGIGIAVEHQHRITERFYRVDVARSREKQGTGLGLAIVKHILNRHGSRLKVTSEPGEGAEFSIHFTLHEPVKK